MTEIASTARRRRTTRFFAMVLAASSLGFGIAGLAELSPEQWGVGFLGFGVLLALLSMLAQNAEHFARSTVGHADTRWHAGLH
jgi:hypothetical protein